ncbi:MAG TPA: hypothetical protein VF598_06900 [Hymenobacter sp.]|jgi:hypothetical protein
MKTLLIVLLLLATGRAQAQFLSLKKLLLLTEKAQMNFLGESKEPFASEKVLREGGFARVRWRGNDPDIDNNPASYKLYSRNTDAFLIFHADAHGRLLEELVYRVRSPACVVQLRKQLVAAGFVVAKPEVVPDEDPNAIVAHFSPYDLYCSNPEYTVTITGEVDAAGKDLHRYTVSIECDAAMQQMQDEINAINEEVQEADQAKPLPKPY